jgi:hypothetical protein
VRDRVEQTIHSASLADARDRIDTLADDVAQAQQDAAAEQAAQEQAALDAAAAEAAAAAAATTPPVEQPAAP